jgi:RimJ/RimL family protein N-acetyltransferase
MTREIGERRGGARTDRLGARYRLTHGEEGAAEALSDHLARLSPRSRRLRFGYEVGPDALARLAAPEPGRRVLLLRDAGGEPRGAATLHAVDARTVELGLSVEDALQGRGLGRSLLLAALALAEEERIARMVVVCLPENHAMRRLVVLGEGEVRVDEDEAVAVLDVARARAALARAMPSPLHATRTAATPPALAAGLARLSFLPLEAALALWRAALGPPEASS